MTHQAVLDYYHDAHFDYVWVWGTWRHLALHLGYHDADHHSHHKAIINMNRQVARRATIQHGHRVLDAGCGIGGTALWLARRLDVDITGVNISPHQLRCATRLARRLGLQDKVRFMERCYTDTGLPDASFDAVYAIESVCYSADKLDFLKEAHRLLKPGGRLVVTDAFRTDATLQRDPGHDYQRCLKGWVIPDFAHGQHFQDAAHSAGFAEVTFEDASRHVLPSSKRLHHIGRMLYPGGKLLEWMRIRNRIGTGNMQAAIAQYRCLADGICVYGIVTAIKGQ